MSGIKKLSNLLSVTSNIIQKQTNQIKNTAMSLSWLELLFTFLLPLKWHSVLTDITKYSEHASRTVYICRWFNTSLLSLVLL